MVSRTFSRRTREVGHPRRAPKGRRLAAWSYISLKPTVRRPAHFSRSSASKACSACASHDSHDTSSAGYSLEYAINISLVVAVGDLLLLTPQASPGWLSSTWHVHVEPERWLVSSR